MGFGIEKALNNDMGLKLEAGFRYTMTDYIDDVSHSYYDRDVIEAEQGNIAASMSGTGSEIHGLIMEWLRRIIVVTGYIQVMPHQSHRLGVEMFTLSDNFYRKWFSAATQIIMIVTFCHHESI